MQRILLFIILLFVFSCGKSIFFKQQDCEGVPDGTSWISDWGLYLNSTADYLPFDGKEHNGDSRFETLTFDIEKGLEDQWKSGKKKLQEKLALKKKSFQNRGKVQTSKYSLNDVLSHLECLVFRENQTGNERDIAEKYGIPYDTFRGKCNTALKLIQTKEILRFFPK